MNSILGPEQRHQLMPPHQAENLQRTLEAAMEEIGPYDDPNPSLAKSAAAHQIPAGHIPLLVHGYNTGRTSAQRLENEGEDRLRSFPLADTADITCRVYPSADAPTTKTASWEYDVDPASFFSSSPAMTKTADEREPSILGSFGEPQELPEIDVKHIQTNERIQAAADVTTARSKLAVALDDCCRDLYDTDDGFANIFHNARNLYGDSSTMDAVEQLAAERLPHRAKEASVGVTPAIGSVYTSIGDVLQAYDAMLEAGRKYAECCCKTNPPVKDDKDSPVRTASIMDKDDPLPLTANALDDEHEKKAFMGIGNPIKEIPSIQEIGTKIPLIGPALESKKPLMSMRAEEQAALRDLRIESMMSDILSNDEVLRDYDADEVLKAYEELAQMAPRVSENEAMIRPLLRNYLAKGSFDTFDIRNVMDIEKTLSMPHAVSRMFESDQS